ncbi:MAG: homoserine dehydrogenase [Fimbriimonadales bacterium]
MSRHIRIGLLGLGTVGTGLVEIIERNSELIRNKSDVTFEIVKALVKDPNKPRPLPPEKITTDPEQIFTDKEIDLIVEVIGGISPAREYIIRAFECGKDVVTANKAVLATHGDEIFRSAASNGKQLGFEASVCGGIPILRAITSGLIGNRVNSLTGILNGTSNFILTRMQEEFISFEDALQIAKEKGLAEADPTLDVSGMDAGHKLMILAELTFQAKPKIESLKVEGITSLDPNDFRTADSLGFVIKPVAMANRVSDQLDLRVHPALVPKNHHLAAVRNEDNAVIISGDAIGEMVFHGKGAGSLPTASAVLSDLVEIARNPNSSPLWNPTRTIESTNVDSCSRFYLRFPIFDRPGMIGLISTVLGNHQISITDAIARLVCDETNQGNVMIMTHEAPESAVRAAIEHIRGAGALNGPAIALRIIG